MITGREEFFNLVREGREGKNIGLSVGSKRLESFIDGYLPGTSYLIGAASGVGKSTYTLWTFVYQPLIHFLDGECPERDPRWLLFSLEMTRSQVYAKLVSMYIMDKFGVELRYKEMFSRGKDCILSDDRYELLEKASEFMDILDERLTFYEGSLTEAVYLREVEKELRKYLIDNAIYCPIHWPKSKFHNGINQRAEMLYSQELSLVCDQRYGSEDMNRIVECIRKYYKR